jgi:hypothetical protein
VDLHFKLPNYVEAKGTSSTNPKYCNFSKEKELSDNTVFSMDKNVLPFMGEKKYPI